MIVAVLGSGNGGCAVAFDCSTHGHEVRVFDFESFPDNIQAIQEARGINAQGELEGFAPIAYAGFDIQQAITGADLIFAVGPAYSTAPFAQACKPYLQAGQMVIVCPGSCGGALVFKQAAGLAVRDSTILVAETSTLPYAVRLLEPGFIKVFLKLKHGLFLAALPSAGTDQILDSIRDIYPAVLPAMNILQTTLQNGNPVIHPAVTLLNTALIERTQGDFLFYEEGVTQAAGRLIRAIDRERILIGKEVGVNILPEPELGVTQGYMTEATYDTGYSKAPGFRGIKAQSTLNNRYFNEDVGYGLVFWASIGKQLGVPTPAISALIQLASIVMDRDYHGEAARTMESLGLSAYDAGQLSELLN